MPVSQDYMDRRGKMYRINLDGTIPDDNPKWEEETIPGLYALGISATQGLTL
jgi:glucose/arabinose dehydrogenase